MTNGGILPLQTADDVRVWAQVHRAQSADHWHTQRAFNKRMEEWMISQERRVRTIENRGARVTGMAVVIGGVIAALVPLLITKLTGG